jgi:UPF0042 nucleotide-binding protein
MLIRIISYGHKFYEEQGLNPPSHDFLFSLRDLKNPFWIPELREFTGLDSQIQDFFSSQSDIQERLNKIKTLVKDFVADFSSNQSRNEESEMCFAFKCTGGKHRSVYFAQAIFDYLNQELKENDKLSLLIEHVDLPRYQSVKS